MKALLFCFIFIWAYIIFVTYINCTHYINFNNLLSFNIQKNNNYAQCFRNEYIEEYNYFKKKNSISFKIQHINNCGTCDKINQLMPPKNVSINNDKKNIKYNYKNNKCYLICYDTFHNSNKNEKLIKKFTKNNLCNNYIINLNEKNNDQIYKYDTQEIESILYFLKIYTQIINHDIIKIVRNVYFFNLPILDLRNLKNHKIEEIFINSQAENVIEIDRDNRNLSYIPINENVQSYYNYSTPIKNNIVDLKNVYAHDFKRFTYFNKIHKVLDIDHSKHRKKIKKHYNMQNNDSICLYSQSNEHEHEKSFFNNNANPFCYFKNMGLNICTLGNDNNSLKTEIVILGKQVNTLEVVIKKTKKMDMDNYLKSNNKSNENNLSTNIAYNYEDEVEKNMNIVRKKKYLSSDDTKNSEQVSHKIYKNSEQVSHKTYKNSEHNNIYQFSAFNNLWYDVNKYLYIMYAIFVHNINNYIFQLIDMVKQYGFYTNNIKYEHTQNITSYSYKPDEIDKHFLSNILFTILKDIEFVNFFNTPEKSGNNHNLKNFNICEFDYVANFRANLINPFIMKKNNIIANTCIATNLTTEKSRCYFVSYEFGDYLVQVKNKIKMDDDYNSEEIIIDSIISEHEKKVIENMKARSNYTIDFPLYLNKIYPDIYNSDCNIFNRLKWVLSIFLIPSWIIIILIYIIMSQEIWRHEFLNPLHKLLLSPSIIRLSSFIILLIFCNLHCYYYMYNKIMEYAILAFMTLNTLFNTLFFGNLLLISKGYMVTRRYFNKRECLFLTLVICYIYILISFNQLNIVNDAYMLIYLYSFLLCILVANIISIIDFLSKKLAYVRDIGMYNWEQSIYTKINMYKHYLCIVVTFFSFEISLHTLNITFSAFSRNVALIQYTIEFIMWASVLYIFRYRGDVLYYSILYDKIAIKTIPLYICNYKEELSKMTEFDIDTKKQKRNTPIIIINPLEFPNQNLLSSLDVGWIVRHHYHRLNI
ncbi:conserved Plasmodium protein, unknown function [Plasmodium vinckei vinckei]|uniref:Uncharacterized protein n=1 Tax=Plasmodium vinckei vinckei TaxID=54757 RepID=A0A449BXH7_PLAVN|nr:conserved Plasmodium protein, unknown function [Plasmodium vinckei vinckei]KEG04530.1 hypothetical protein YYE_00105 [Plasmodium vinckei vinckei]VEV58180.1 conserved Plasmodium protein, unknown function [Plasmodium vinckei vinckei]